MNDFRYIIDKFLEICPEFNETWQAHLEYWENDTPGFFLDIAELALFKVNSYEVGNIEKFDQIFEQVEKYFNEGDNDVIGVISVGLLEDIQNTASWKELAMRFLRSG